MGRLNYSINPGGRSSRAMGHELHISQKHAREICLALRGMKASQGQQFLEEVIALRKAVPFRRYARNVAHKPGMTTGWPAGRYPQKAAREILVVLKNAVANAEYKGMEAEKLRIGFANTKKGRTLPGWMPRAMGRATPKNTETVSVELILTEGV
ncbi:MAG: 50S ribosomal protein L22P [Methanosaeta sp. PtaB.Bin039]|nr:MAG: 50S ribosomal protein L22P [Methanosaeta sp. PtaB.Bin039]HOT07477.1 50S ribosomal protein L22 [Methanotrichaceae archaeon]HQF16998.1 50S ribosomal protein L22 [Methanotrichaceae archaeon]HQI91618.1 50S ribosomal protein L22 [Methanotrichaceae archaeon]HQJ28888.1 50S ribosomal protein L22 [Methanotrichaceae archaeon]